MVGQTHYNVWVHASTIIIIIRTECRRVKISQRKNSSAAMHTLMSIILKSHTQTHTQITHIKDNIIILNYIYANTAHASTVFGRVCR